MSVSSSLGSYCFPALLELGGFRPPGFSVPAQIEVKAVNRGPAVPEQEGKLEENSYLAPNIIKIGVLLLLFCFTCLIKTGFFPCSNSLQGRSSLDCSCRHCSAADT